jgi:hypothetical protein
MLMSTADRPSSTTPSVATFSPGHHEAGAHGQLLDGDAALAPVVVEDRDLLGAELEQRLERGAGAALGARLEVAPRQDEHRDGGGDLEVQLARSLRRVGDEIEGHPHLGHAGVAQEQRVQRPAVRGDHAHRDQRVHRGGAVLEVLPGGAVQRPGPPHEDRRGQLERQPLPVVELQGRDDRQDQHRQRQQRREDQPPAQRGGLVDLRLGLRHGGRERRPVAGGLDARHEVAGLDQARVEVDPRLLGGVVHRGGDALELVELALDPVGARRAGHAGDRQLEVIGDAAHDATSFVNPAVWTRPSCWNCRNRR